MPGKGRHRRPKNSLINRRFAAVGTSGIAMALPVISATDAGAATASAPAVTQVNAAAKSALPAAQKGAVNHTVAAGETLHRIARMHELKGGWKQLYADNRTIVGDNPSLIRPGMKLVVSRYRAEGPAAGRIYPDNLDGWIRQSLDVMALHGIPGSYHGIHRNIMRESSGNRWAVNNWDSNARAGTPSKGLLQVIAPTFTAYHVPGTLWDPFDPVANITAACNYAADRYGSINNVYGAY
ncbi:LysM peptidoglycan-binding domain-containing protein [Streptomyces sp. NBC_01017]|uniref:LysM peptidoglycan-binding domain-containing protein n=1 Tax=Streptomyces sp. NBC_01017 TaxID=2903721 RepID=UPI003867CF5F|nr:LysM peptidoglycan-binding domain-containing protein [Streptomyces sp. NBC_01017]WSV35385.1 LysM peptidoglycan-binding domain-containing protein [Streptomyces sp. NBC_01017]